MSASLSCRSPHSPLSVAAGSVLALWAVAALAVVGGRGLLRWVNVATIRIVTTVILIGLALPGRRRTLNRSRSVDVAVADGLFRSEGCDAAMLCGRVKHYVECHDLLDRA